MLRYLSQKHEFQLGLASFPVEAVLRDDYSNIEISKMVKLAYERATLEPTTPVDEIRDLLRVEIATLDDDIRRFCSGHDLARILSTALRKFCDGAEGAQSLERAIRSALSPSDWKTTEIYTAIQLWSQQENVRIWAY